MMALPSFIRLLGSKAPGLTSVKVGLRDRLRVQRSSLCLNRNVHTVSSNITRNAATTKFRSSNIVPPASPVPAIPNIYPYRSLFSSIHIKKAHSTNTSNNKNVTLLACGVCSGQRRYAGHSKWSNIRHIKAAKDGEKSAMNHKMLRNIKVAIKEGGGSDPKFNNQLARFIATAYDNDVPKAVVEKALTNAVASAANTSIVMYDGKGPGSFMMLIETMTTNSNRTRMAVYSVFKKFGGKMNDKPMGGHFFEHKGIILAMPCDNMQCFDEAEEAGIMAEVEEVENTFDDGGNCMFQFICDPKEAHNSWKKLVEQNPDVEFNKPVLHYLPKDDLLTPLCGPTLAAAQELVEALEGVHEVLRVYTNIKVEEQT